MSSPAISYEKVKEHLNALSMQTALAVLDGVLEDGQKQQRTCVETLVHRGGSNFPYRFSGLPV